MSDDARSGAPDEELGPIDSSQPIDPIDANHPDSVRPMPPGRDAMPGPEGPGRPAPAVGGTADGGASRSWSPKRSSRRAAEVAGTRAAAAARIRALLRAEPPGPVQRLFWRAVERSYVDRPDVLLHLCDALTDRGASISRLAETYFASGRNRIGTALDLLSLAEDDPDRLPGFELLEPEEQALCVEVADVLADAANAYIAAAEHGGLATADLETAIFRASAVAERVASLPESRRWLVAAQCRTRFRVVEDAIAEAREIVEHRRNRLRVLSRLGRTLERMIPDAPGAPADREAREARDAAASGLDDEGDLGEMEVDLGDFLEALGAFDELLGPDPDAADDADSVDGTLPSEDADGFDEFESGPDDDDPITGPDRPDAN